MAVGAVIRLGYSGPADERYRWTDDARARVWAAGIEPSAVEEALAAPNGLRTEEHKGPDLLVVRGMTDDGSVLAVILVAVVAWQRYLIFGASYLGLDELKEWNRGT